jgi:hypothetical protein
MRNNFTSLLIAVCLVFAPTALASTTWYVDGVNGNDNNDCKSSLTACKTIGRAISLASSGDSISVAAATYTENLTIGISVKVIGANTSTMIIDGNAVGTVVTSSANVTLSDLTITHGHNSKGGGGVINTGTLTIIRSMITGNRVDSQNACLGVVGFSGRGGILNRATLTVVGSTVSGNTVHNYAACGGGIYSVGTLTVNNSTVSGNSIVSTAYHASSSGAGIYVGGGSVAVNDSTISGNVAAYDSLELQTSSGGGISGGATISNSTISGNNAESGGGVSSILFRNGSVLQNSILADNGGGNCGSAVTTDGYNLSSDNTCNFNGPGDLNNTDPKLGTLGNYGGPTQTIPLLNGSPAIDAGNPNGCTDGQGHLLTTDQRGKPRPDKEDSSGCDMGAYERQLD